MVPCLLTAQAPGTDSTLIFPAPADWVNDYAGVLSDSTRHQLSALASEVRLACRGEIAVVTVPMLYGRDARVVARNLGRQWGVGPNGPSDDPHTNTGIVLLLAPSDRQIALEVGTGATAFLSDSVAGAILDSLVVPQLKEGRWEAGLLAGTWAVARRFADRFGFQLPRPIGAPP